MRCCYAPITWSTAFPGKLSELFNCSDGTRIVRKAERVTLAYVAIPQQGPFQVCYEMQSTPCG